MSAALTEHSVDRGIVRDEYFGGRHQTHLDAVVRGDRSKLLL